METKRFIVATALILSSFVLAQAQTARPLMLNETSYRLRAGEVAEIAAPSETLEFVSNATIRRVESAGKEVRGIVVGPSRAGDKLRLGVSVLMKPGEYALTLRAIGKTGEIRETPLKVTVDAIKPVPSDATQPPVILLNGFQGPFGCTPEPSSDTFGNLETYLQSDNISTYWFDNCAVCPGCAIEELGNDLAATIALATSGMTVPQVDLIAHSMGGLIIRSYLSGKQTTSGVFFPPLNPEVRKAIFIATPHFGSYLANLADWFNGVQAAEMTPGSQFVIDLAKWNQFQDDLRGVDALAAIGNAGPDNNVAQTSDGVVSLTSASLKLTSATLTYAEPDVRTRIVEYCHITFNTAEALVTGCYFPGIAYIDTTLHPTYQIIQSFLANTTAWEDTTVSTTPSMDPYLSAYGSVIIGEKTANDQWVTDLNSIIVSNANLNFAAGPSNPLASLFFNEWVPAGSYDLTMYNSTNDYLTGVLTTIAGGGMAIFFKPDTSPIIHSVQSEFISSLAGLSVASGSNITISGPLGDGPYQIFANGTPISISSSSSQQIVAYLPASFIGLVPIEILTNTGQNTINIMAGPPAVYTISGQATLSGSGLSGVTMTLSGSQGGSTTTDGSGNYSFTVPAGGNYTVTPSLAGYIFYLPSLSFNNLSSSQGGANFTALAQSINPAPGTVLSDSLADFSWSAVSGATQYQLTVGTTPGGTNIFSGTTAGTSQTVNFIPCTGGTIYVELSAYVGGSFQPAGETSYPCKSAIGDFNGDGHQDLVWQNNSTRQVTVNYYGDATPVAQGWNYLNSGGVPGWHVVGTGDFDGNGVPDLVWQNDTTRQVTVNYYGGAGGAVYQGWAYLDAAGDPGWSVVGVADMDGNGVPDLIWQNDTTKVVTVNYYGGAGGAVYQGWAYLNSTGNPGWSVVGVADFDGNGTPDLVWQNLSTRQVTVNYYGGTGGATYQNWAYLNAAGVPGWTVVGARDFNADGVPDLVWQNDTTHQVSVNFYGGQGGAVYEGWNWINSTGYTGWQVAGVADFDGNGEPDVVWLNNSTRQVTVNYYGFGGAVYQSWNNLNNGVAGWHVVGTGDFDGNGVPDLVWQNDSTRQVTVNYYGGAGGAVYQGWAYLNAAGVPGWSVVAVADMNGDGVPDLIWQNDTTNQVTVNYYGGAGGAVYQGWNWLNSVGEPAGWLVVGAADFDGNGTPDLVWQNSATRQITVNYYGGVGGATYKGWTYLNAAGVPGWTVVGASDFDGNGFPDLVLESDTTGQAIVDYYGGAGGAVYQGSNSLGFANPGWRAIVPKSR